MAAESQASHAPFFKVYPFLQVEHDDLSAAVAVQTSQLAGQEAHCLFVLPYNAKYCLHVVHEIEPSETEHLTQFFGHSLHCSEFFLNPFIQVSHWKTVFPLISFSLHSVHLFEQG